MTEAHFYILLALGISLVVLQLAVLLRKQSFETPADLSARMGLLEQGVQGLVQATARNEAGTDRIDQQLRGFIETTTAGFDASKKTLDEQLARTVDESRSGRTELTNAFQAFETKLELRIGGFDTSLTSRFEALQQVLAGRLEDAGKAMLGQLTQAQTDAATARTEMTQTLAGFRTEMTNLLGTLSGETSKSRLALAESATAFEARIQERFEALTTATRGTLDSLENDITTQLGVMSTAMKETTGGQRQPDSQSVRHAPGVGGTAAISHGARVASEF